MSGRYPGFNDGLIHLLSSTRIAIRAIRCARRDAREDMKVITCTKHTYTPWPHTMMTPAIRQPRNFFYIPIPVAVPKQWPPTSPFTQVWPLCPAEAHALVFCGGAIHRWVHSRCFSRLSERGGTRELAQPKGCHDLVHRAQREREGASFRTSHASPYTNSCETVDDRVRARATPPASAQVRVSAGWRQRPLRAEQGPRV